MFRFFIAYPAEIVFGVVMFSGIGVAVHSVRQARVTSPIWRLTPTGWQESRGPRGDVFDIQISPGGKVWAAWVPGLEPDSRGGLLRLDGDRWTSLGAPDFGTTNGYISGGFTFDGEDVWAATPDAVIHFDGHRWNKFAVAKPPDSIAAGNHEAWTIESSGTLGHYTDAGTENIDIRESIPRAGWTQNSRPNRWYRQRMDPRPSIARTANGTLWIVWGGLWRLEHERWNRVPAANSARLLRATGNLLWLWDEVVLTAVRADGTIARVVSPEKKAVTDVSMIGDRIWVSCGFSNRLGLVELSGHQQIGPPYVKRGPGRFAVAPEGVVWATMLPRRSR